MSKFKERPKMDKPKTKPTPIPLKQAARILSENYRKQLDQRPEGSENETTDAEKVEGAGRQAVEEIASHRSRTHGEQKPIKQKEKPTTSGEKQPQKANLARPKTRPQNPLRTKEIQEQAKPRQPAPSSPRQRSNPSARKETASRAKSPTPRQTTASSGWAAPSSPLPTTSPETGSCTACGVPRWENRRKGHVAIFCITLLMAYTQSSIH